MAHAGSFLLAFSLAWQATAQDNLEEPPAIKESGNEAFGGSVPAATFSIRTLTQIRYRGTFADTGSREETATAEQEDGYRLNRVFLRLTANPSKQVGAKVLVDFAEFTRKNAKRALKLAFAEMHPFSRMDVTAGLFKRSFSLLELLPIADFEFADVGPTDNLIKDFGYGGRDIGAMVRAAPLPKKKWLSLSLGAFSGDAQEGYDASPVKLITARAESKITPNLRLGVDVARRNSVVFTVQKIKIPDPDDPSKDTATFPSQEVLSKGTAWSADATFSYSGFELRAEGMLGHRTDVRWRGAAQKFFAAWAIATYRFQIGGLALFPAFRAEWLDVDQADTEGRGTGGRWFLSGALNVQFTDSVRLLLDLSHYRVQDGTGSFADIPWRSQGATDPDTRRPLDIGWTAFIVQLQVVI